MTKQEWLRGRILKRLEELREEHSESYLYWKEWEKLLKITREDRQLFYKTANHRQARKTLEEVRAIFSVQTKELNLPITDGEIIGVETVGEIGEEREYIVKIRRVR